VLVWRAVPVEYEIKEPAYMLRVWRGGERFPRVYFRAVQSIALSCDSAGRLTTLTTPTETYGYVYSPQTGALTSVNAPAG